MSKNISTSMHKDIATPTQLEKTMIHIKEQIKELPDTCNWYVMHDSARAVEAAAVILKHKDLQVEASIAISEVERIINSMTPSKKPGKKKGKADDETISQEANERELGFQKYRFRQAHENLSDEKFEELKTEARETGEPLSRRRLIQESNKEAKKNQPQEEQKQETETEPERKTPSKVDLKKENSDFQGQINELTEMNERLGNDDTKYELAKALEELRVCRSSLQQAEFSRNQYRDKSVNQTRMINAQKTRIQKLDAQVEKLEERIEIMSEESV